MMQSTTETKTTKTRFRVEFHEWAAGGRLLPLWLELDAFDPADAIDRAMLAHAARYKPSMSCARPHGSDTSVWTDATARPLTAAENAKREAQAAIHRLSNALSAEWREGNHGSDPHTPEAVALRAKIADAREAARVLHGKQS